MTETDRLAEVGKLAQYLDEGGVALLDVVVLALLKQSGTNHLLLVADQWEELYTLTQDESTRRRFIDEVLHATARGPLSVVFTLRGDFFGHVIGYRGLADRLQGAVIHLGPMLREELQLAMEVPANKVGLTFEHGLGTRILDNIDQAPGNLPLLELVLTELWETRRGGHLLHDTYEAMGELQGAIARRADETFERLTPMDQEAARRVFLQLVPPGEGTADTRRWATYADVGDAVRPVVQDLADARLLVTGRDEATGEETLDVAHEALIRHWDRLRNWLDQDWEFLLWHQRLRGAVAEWEHTEHDAGVLLRGAPLSDLPGHRGPVEELALSRDGTWLASGDGNRTLLLWDLRMTPPRSTALSGHQANVWRLRFSPDGAWLASSDGSSLLLWNLHMPRLQSFPLAGHQGHVHAFTFSPDGKTLASVGTAGTLLLWDLRGPSPRSTVLPSHPDHRRIISFSPDGKILALDRDKGSLLLWDLGVTPHRSIALTGHHGGINALTFSPDGTTLASGDMSGTLRLWDLRVKPPRSMLLPGYQAAARPIAFGPTVGVREFTFSPDGKILAATAKSTSLLWDLRTTPPLSLRLSHEQRSAGDLTFSPDGKTLASGSTLWNVDFVSWPAHACRLANRNLTCTEWAQFMKAEPYRPSCEYLPFEICDGGFTGLVTLE
jgi:WD40 repeat protein